MNTAPLRCCAYPTKLGLPQQWKLFVGTFNGCAYPTKLGLPQQGF